MSAEIVKLPDRRPRKCFSVDQGAVDIFTKLYGGDVETADRFIIWLWSQGYAVVPKDEDEEFLA